MARCLLQSEPALPSLCVTAEYCALTSKVAHSEVPGCGRRVLHCALTAKVAHSEVPGCGRRVLLLSLALSVTCVMFLPSLSAGTSGCWNVVVKGPILSCPVLPGTACSFSLTGATMWPPFYNPFPQAQSEGDLVCPTNEKSCLPTFLTMPQTHCPPNKGHLMVRTQGTREFPGPEGSHSLAYHCVYLKPNPPARAVQAECDKTKIMTHTHTAMLSCRPSWA